MKEKIQELNIEYTAFNGSYRRAEVASYPA